MYADGFLKDFDSDSRAHFPSESVQRFIYFKTQIDPLVQQEKSSPVDKVFNFK